ncbi:amino acid permease 6-like [Macadamia integrifolia]|uniref:amino acid permease 6-like n=1 Tax=Macadamia integrifolia TaxID=60698 RepID=UPI001C4E81BE|nr:amino acid permease 6-like [Macadamia integrifolia]
MRGANDSTRGSTGTWCTASAHIITGVIGSGILSLSWAVAQLGWIAGPATLFIFSFITLYTSILLADCYRSPNPARGTRNYSYMEAVPANLGKKMSMVCGFTQYIFIFGMAIGYTITASTSMGAIHKSNCYHNRGHDAPCKISTNLFMILFGMSQIILSQIPSFHKLSMLSFIAALMSFIYALIGVMLSFAKVISGDVGQTSLKGAMVMANLSENQKVWRMFRSAGNIAFSYAFSPVLIEIQDTLRSPPAENKSMKKAILAIHKSNCYHNRGHDAPCKISTNLFMTLFGMSQIILSQIPNFHKLSMLSFIAALMSFIYALIGVMLSFAKVISGDVGQTSLKGAMVMANLSENQKVWRMFRSAGNIAFSYAFSPVLIEIQDTLRSPPAENKSMKKAIFMGVSTTTLFYVFCGCMGYAAFGSEAPGNMLTSFGFYEPFWLVDLGNVCIVVHLVGAYQVFIQPLYAVIESWAARRWPKSKFITSEYPISIFGLHFSYSLNFFRLVWRTIFVVLVTVLAMAFPFFNDILPLLGAVGYWPLTVYFPIEMYITRKKIKRFTYRWVGVQLLNFGCLLVAIAAALGSIQGVVEDLNIYKPFKSKQ